MENEQRGLGKRIASAARYGVLVAFIVFMCLLLMFVSMNGYAITCIAASAFIAFALPISEKIGYRNLVGGYAIGAGAGLLTHLIFMFAGAPGEREMLVVIAGCTVAVFISTVLMLLLNCPHPPAAALAATLMIDAAPLHSAGVAMICILLVCVVKSVVLRVKIKRRAERKAAANPDADAE